MKIKSKKRLYLDAKSVQRLKLGLIGKPFVLVMSVVGLSLIVITASIFYGATLQKNQTMSSIQQIIFNAAESKLDVVSNYLSGRLSSPDMLYIDLGFEEIQALNFARQSALKKGLITDEEQKVSVKGTLSLNSDVFKVKISPTGLNLDMIGSINKRAYKVKVLGGKKIYGMSEFKLLPPGARHNVVEWVGHQLERQEGLVALRYFFVEATLNGTGLGVYAFEEHFNKELLENNRSREGLIFTEKYGKIKVFNEKKYSKDETKTNQIRLLKAGLQSIRNGDLEIDRLFHLEKFAKHYAIIDLMNSFHAVGINAFYYFNPVTNLIEPITREYNSLRYSEGPPSASRFALDMYKDDNSQFLYINKLFENQDFQTFYTKTLTKISDPQYLDNFFETIAEELDSTTNIIYRDNPFYKFPKEYMYERQRQIIDWLNKDSGVVAHINMGDRKYAFEVRNTSEFFVRLLDFRARADNINLPVDTVIGPGEMATFSFDAPTEAKKIDFDLEYSLVGNNDSVLKTLVVAKSASTGAILPNLWHDSSSSSLGASGINIDYKNKRVSFLTKSIVLNEDIYIPSGFLVIGQPGLRINLQDGASIYSKSAFSFIGSEDEPITVTSSDGSGALAILGPQDDSYFSSTIFENLSTPNKGYSGLSASLSFYETRVTLSNCIFRDNHAEDLVNVINAQYKIVDSRFINVMSDAIDSDFSDGIISRTTFESVGNDAIDLSGSKADINNISINGVGDKAISAGENSTLKGVSVAVMNAEIAITSKDLSLVDLTDITISDTKLGFAIFQKKKEFGAGRASIKNLSMDNISQVYLVGTTSSLSLNEEEVTDKRQNVADLLYGAIYGKSSK